MSLFHGSKIITNGLVLHLDAANKKSYNSSENLVSYSTYNASTWSNIFPANATLTTGINAPDKTNTAVRLTCNTAGTSLLRVSIPSFTPNGTDTYTLSFYVRKISGTISSGSVLTTDLNDGSPNGDYLPNLITNEWVRVSFSAVLTATSKTFVDLLGDNANNYVLDFWGLQLEKNTIPSTYTPTTGSTINKPTTWTDLSGNGNNGTLTLGPTYNSLNNGSIVFDGVDDFVNISNFKTSFAFNSAYTISSWIRPTGVNSIDIVSCYNQASNDGVWLELNTVSNFVRFVSRNLGTTIFDLSTTESVGTSVWKNIVATFNESTAKIYINGVESATVASSGTFFTVANSDLNIGRIDPNLGRYFPGNISSVLIYNKELSPLEITQNFNALRGRYGL